MHISAISLLALTVGAVALPTSEKSESLEKRCEWHDGHGPISWYELSPKNYLSTQDTNCLKRRFQHCFRAEGRERSEFIMKGNNFETRGFPRCDPWRGHIFQNFESPLPYVLQVAPGNTCETRLPEAWWDDLHIRYAGTFLNAPTDTRCGPVENGWGRRCIIAQRP
ncbi:hypothetical protein FCULG_00011883 [Fusarium culmorum]|uniref:Uncharacterized protein n=1 Tax=Fusarium culmorum TaxID=5516 RepID=A0A2T4GFP1_FUSCU|nr:hypothetical protein FCULG_00011883 [Fusarium culmorum]